MTDMHAALVKRARARSTHSAHRGPRRGRARGFTLIEVLAALAIAAMMLVGLVAMINSSLADTQAQQAALYQSQLTTAATQLIRQNYTALSAAATTSSPVVVGLTGTTYQLSTYLSSAMNNANSYGQTPCLLIYGASPTGALQGLLVTEGGSKIPDAELGYVAANSGAGGGSIQAINTPAGEAKGAYGSWTLATPNPAGASCSGTATGVGHPVSLIYYNGAQAQNADYLYRVAVPGDPAANTMQVPIVLAQGTTAYVDYAPCTQAGSIAADSDGNVLNCNAASLQWTPEASFHWREPVADAASLPTPANQGDVRMTNATNRAYVYNGTAWQALAVDESGDIALGNSAVIGASCSSAANTTSVTTDAAGDVLSCQNGTWEPQTAILPGTTYTGCQLIVPNPNPVSDYDCPADSAPDYGNTANTGAGYSYNGTNGTYSYTYMYTVSLTKPGVIVASTWAHMNDGLCGSTPGYAAQISQDVDITGPGITTPTHIESQSPTLTDDSGGINNSLTQAGSAGTFTVTVVTNWATYSSNLTTPWTSNYCGTGGTTIQNTAVAAGWTISTYY
jgi:prepilin-type N-terminal cleavage/methylation domain-containing protein